MLRDIFQTNQVPRRSLVRGVLAALRVVPSASHVDRLSQYRLDETLGNHLDLVFTVKHQKQRALNRIVRERLRDGHPMKVLGGRTPRPYRDGLLVQYALRNGLMRQMDLKEPFGLDQSGARLAVAAGNEVRIYDTSAQVAHVYRNPWFAQLHSVHFSGDGSRLLTVSTGFDTVLEFDLAQPRLTWAWNAWDHGYNVSPAGIRILRGAPGSDATTRKLITVGDPRHWDGFGLPTYLTAAHLNNACYCRHDDSIFVTLFHQGRAVVVDRNGGKAREVLTGLLNPHGFEPGWAGDHLVTDTCRGQVIFFDEHLAVKNVLMIDACEPAQSRTGMGEWLQNVLHLDRGLYGAIDIHRSCIWLFEPATRRHRKVEVNPDWAVQNVIAADPQKVKALYRRLDDYPEIYHDIADSSSLMAADTKPPRRSRLSWHSKLRSRD